jgi:hypothetical protein
MAVTKLPNKKREGVLEILEEAIEREYDEVIVIGFAGPKYYITNSEMSNGLKIIGALAMAQHELLKIGDDGV